MSSIYVEEFGRVLSRDEIYEAVVHDFMWCVLEVDWRDFFPYLSWVPNESFETKVLTTEARRTAVMRALINRQKERIARGEVTLIYSHLIWMVMFFFWGGGRNFLLTKNVRMHSRKISVGKQQDHQFYYFLV